MRILSSLRWVGKRRADDVAGRLTGRVLRTLGIVAMVVLAGCSGGAFQGIGYPTVDNVRQDVPETHPDGPLNASEVRQLERIVLDMTNHERGRRGIGDLQWSPELARVNDYHAWNMWNRSYFYHIEPDGDGPGNRVEQFGYQCPDALSEVQQSSVVLERDTLQTLARDLIDGWMQSSAHRKAMLNEHYRVAGVGIYVDGSDTVYAVIVFCDEVVERPANVRGTNETVPQPPTTTPSPTSETKFAAGSGRELLGPPEPTMSSQPHRPASRRLSSPNVYVRKRR